MLFEDNSHCLYNILGEPLRLSGKLDASQQKIQLKARGNC